MNNVPPIRQALDEESVRPVRLADSLWASVTGVYAAVNEHWSADRRLLCTFAIHRPIRRTTPDSAGQKQPPAFYG